MNNVKLLKEGSHLNGHATGHRGESQEKGFQHMNHEKTNPLQMRQL